MRRYAGALLIALLSCGLVGPAGGQEIEGYVLPPGVVRLTAGGEYAGFNRVHSGGGREFIGADLRGPLVPANFAPLRPLEASLGAFLAATAAAPGATPFPLSPDSLSLGTVDARVFLSRVSAPLRLEIGVMPRLQLGVSMKLVRGDAFVERFSLGGATVGRNPDRAANADLLGRVGGNGAELGASPLLPTAESAAGQELQRRVRAATGDSLNLPSAAGVDEALLQGSLANEFGVDSLRGSRGRLRPGDVEIEARFTLLDQVQGQPLPAGRSGTAYRAVVVAGLRLPTGAPASDSLRLYPADPQTRLSGARLGLVGDAFVGQRWWIAFGLQEVLLRSGRVLRRVAPTDAPLGSAAPAELVDWNPADTLELRVAPRYRLSRLISVGLEYQAGLVSASSYGGSAAGVLDTSGGLAQTVGIGVRFTSVPAYAAREAGLPLEVSAGYFRTLSGPAGTPAASGARLQGSVLTSLWGSGLRR